MSDVPEGWAETTIEALLREPLRNGHSAKASGTGRGLRTLTLTAVTQGEFTDANTKLTVAVPAKVADLWLEPGDIFVERANTPELVGTAALYDGPRQWAIFPDLLIRVRVRESLVLPAFVDAFMRSERARRYFTGAAQGSAGTMPKIDQGVVAQLSIPLAPLPEQRRIVAKVDALQGRLNGVRARLEKVPLLLKQFRQAVLAKALRGELVPTEAELAALEGRAFQSPSALLGRSLDVAIDELPEGWVSTTVEQVLRPGGIFDGPFGSSLKTSDYVNAGIRVIRLENVANLRFVAEKETWISKAKYVELKRHSVGEGDIIFGSFVDDSCRVCILPALPTPAIAKADCFCLRPRDELVDRRFLVYQLGSAATRNALVEEIHGATRPRINTGQLRALNIVLPPIAEQRRIVAKVDALFAAAAIVEARTESLRAALGRAPQTILQRAFSGELVPTEADLAATEQREFESGNDLLKGASDSLAAVPRPRRTRTPAATG